MSNISKESILKFLQHDENTGNFLWIDNFSRKSKKGKVAGGRFSSITQAKEERNRLIKMVHGKFLNTKGEQYDTTNER